jgi:cob(I)alamin adenosyltransferase
MSIYTKKGDQGRTHLISGERVSKNHPLIQVGGDVDELNSIIGAVVAFLPEAAAQTAGELKRIQRDLLTMCAQLSAMSGSSPDSRLAQLEAEQCHWLEARIDAMSAALPPFKTFILPGGHAAAAWAHVARCICRRAERGVVALADAGADPVRMGPILAYLNRLSDFLFVLARYLNRAAGVAESFWSK